MYQVVIVDDEKMIINSLALGFPWKDSGFEVVATATNSADALNMIRFIRPHVVFTDMKMPGMSGIELMKQVQETLPQIKFVIISGYSDFAYAQQAIRLGALAYCLKPLENEDIADALALAKKSLDSTNAVIQSAFNKLLWQPSQYTSADFLSSLFSEQEQQHTLCAAVSVGDAQSLLTGNVGFTAVQVWDGCTLYLISSNREYLDGYAFQAALLGAAAENKIRAFAFVYVDNPAAFLAEGLGDLLNQAYGFFMQNEKIVLGKISLHTTPTENDLVDKLSVAANKNRPAEVLTLFAEMTPQMLESLTCAHAVTIYNVCTALLYRLQNRHSEPKLQYGFELAAQFKDFAQMVQQLCGKLGALTNGSVNLDMVRNETLRRVLQHLHLHYTQPLQFQQICKLYSISPSYLSQLFKKELGINFMNYLYNLRLHYAKELLENTNLRVQEISDKVGFDFYYNFSKLFKREIGMTPKQYRDLHQQDKAILKQQDEPR